MMKTVEKTVLSFGAHPDDAEFFCVGTLALLHKKGWQIHIAKMTLGDFRKAEAAKSASILDGSYHCLECDDIFIIYDRPTLLKAIELSSSEKRKEPKWPQRTMNFTGRTRL